MRSGVYVLSSPTLALVKEGDRHSAVTVPRGETLTIAEEAFCGDRLIETVWAGRTVLMFADDLRAPTQRHDHKVISIATRKAPEKAS